MSTPIGGMGHLGLRRESSFASGGTIDNWQPFISESIGLTVNNIYSDRIANTSEQVYGQRGTEAVAGNLTFMVSPQNPTQWWAAGIGQTSNPFYSQRPLASLMLEIDRDTAAVGVSGCMIGSMTFSSSEGQPLTCACDVEAAGMGSRTAGSPTFISGDAPYLHHEGTFYLNNISDNSIRSFSVTVNNSLSTDLYGTGLRRIDIPAGKQVVTGTFTKLFDDTTERNAFLNMLPRSFKAVFQRTVGTSDRRFVIWVNKLRYNTHPEQLGGQSEFIIESFNWTAYVDDPTVENQIRISGDTV